MVHFTKQLLTIWLLTHATSIHNKSAKKLGLPIHIHTPSSTLLKLLSVLLIPLLASSSLRSRFGILAGLYLCSNGDQSRSESLLYCNSKQNQVYAMVYSPCITQAQLYWSLKDAKIQVVKINDFFPQNKILNENYKLRYERIWIPAQKI